MFFFQSTDPPSVDLYSYQTYVQERSNNPGSSSEILKNIAPIYKSLYPPSCQAVEAVETRLLEPVKHTQGRCVEAPLSQLTSPVHDAPVQVAIGGGDGRDDDCGSDCDSCDSCQSDARYGKLLCVMCSLRYCASHVLYHSVSSSNRDCA